MNERQLLGQVDHWRTRALRAEAELSTREEEDPRPVPDFEKCGNCGADAKTYCFWDPGDGWTCGACGMSD